MTLIFCLGCKNKDAISTPTQPQMIKNEITPQPQTRIAVDTWFTKAMKAAKITCDGECPKNIGMVGFFEEDYGEDTYVEQCTGFLVAPNIFATNYHCVPEKVKNGETDCTSSMAIAFVDKSGENTLRTCKKVLYHSNVGEVIDLDDYAFIEIEPFNVTPFKISQKGIEDQKTITITKLNPYDDDRLGGAIETATCTTVQNSVLNLFYINQYSRTALALGCEAMGGNSGSPIFNDKGEVIGLLQSKKVEDYLAYLGKQLTEKNNLSMPEEPPPHFVFTNLSCIKHPITGFAETESCDYYRPRSLAFIFNNLVSSNAQEETSLVSQWHAQLPEIFQYVQEDTQGFAHILTAAPKCISQGDWESKKGQVLEYTFSTFLHVVKEYALDEALRFLPQAHYRGENKQKHYKLDLTGEKPNLFMEVNLEDDDHFNKMSFQICK
ncbi:MAG: trypsin-like serine protease [Bdellovibrionaceae bacterium]|nr:trypsin-like serine protease [Pseudobdellovibrionaceae bacterium]